MLLIGFVIVSTLGINVGHNKIKVTISEYWDYFWEQFNSEYYESCQGYADYDECWIKTKKLVDSQIYTSYVET